MKLNSKLDNRAFSIGMILILVGFPLALGVAGLIIGLGVVIVGLSVVDPFLTPEEAEAAKAKAA